METEIEKGIYIRDSDLPEVEERQVGGNVYLRCEELNFSNTDNPELLERAAIRNLSVARYIRQRKNG